MQSPLSSPLRRFLFALALATPLAAQSLAGHVQTSAGAPIAGVTVILSNGGRSAVSDAAGNFLVTGLGNRTYATVDLNDPTSANAPREFTNVTVNGATNLGTITLVPGANISGIALGPGGVPAAGGNMNSYDVNGVKLFTPNDAISATGTFSITVPRGYNLIRAVPPVTAPPLMPYDWELLNVTGPVNLGTVTLTVGYPLTATVVDAVSGVPLIGIKVKTTNPRTGQVYAQANATTNVFGALSLLLPTGVADIELLPGAADAHAPRILYGVIGIAGPTNLGQVPLQRAVFVSGVVQGPGGPAVGADTDFFTLDGHKLFTPKEHTDATGTFHVVVPPGTYVFHTQPTVASNLCGSTIANLTVSANGSIGTVNVANGVLFSGHVLGPSGPEVGGEVRAFDPVTGNELVLNGNHTDATGAFATVLPVGTWNFVVNAAQGSQAAPLTVNNLAVGGPLVHDFALARKDLLVNVIGFTVFTLPQGGALPVTLLVHNLTPNALPSFVDVVVQYPSGAETQVFPPLPIAIAPQVPIGLGWLFMPLPPIPATQLDNVIRYLVRVRSQATGAVLDQAYTTFVVH